MKTIQDVVNLLNELNELDHVAINDLATTRVKCNDKIADHEKVQVISKTDGTTEVGILGILNGLFGTEKARIAAIFDDNDGDLINFAVIETHTV